MTGGRAVTLAVPAGAVVTAATYAPALTAVAAVVLAPAWLAWRRLMPRPRAARGETFHLLVRARPSAHYRDERWEWFLSAEPLPDEVRAPQRTYLVPHLGPVEAYVPGTGTQTFTVHYGRGPWRWYVRLRTAWEVRWQTREARRVGRVRAAVAERRTYGG